MVSLLWIFVFFLPLSVAQDYHFLGGSVSFKFTQFSQAPYKLKITALTGWVLGQGPCGLACNYSDIGRSVNNTYPIMLRDHGKDYFGSWTIEDTNGYTKANVSDIKAGYVVGINSPLNWEQDLTEFDLDIDPQNEVTDIRYTGQYWRKYEYNYENSVRYRIVTRMQNHIRNDTGQPNRSPVATFKPVYKVPLNSKSLLQLAIMDADDDYIWCHKSDFGDAAFLNIMPNVTVRKDCSVEISAFESDGFKDGGLGVVAISVTDQTVHDVAIGNVSYSAGIGFPVSKILVKFMVQTLQELDWPTFVPPTRETRHEFIIYVGAAFTQKLFAKPTSSSSDIQSFFVRSIPIRKFTVQTPKADLTRMSEKVKYTKVSWKPEIEDVGKYLVTATVVDTKLIDGNNRDFVVTVKDSDLNMTLPEPIWEVYFPFIPEEHSITCLEGSTCIFPVYSRSRSRHSIVNVSTIYSSISNTEISTPLKLTAHGLEVYETDVSITPSKGGDDKVCIEAIDDYGSHSGELCINVKTEYHDACISDPCLHAGRCTSYEGKFTCSCRYLYFGELCQSKTDLCATGPCLNNGVCFAVQDRFICVCKPGYTGSKCETNWPCTNGSCLNGGVCDEALHMCDCPAAFTGSRCEYSRPR